LIKESKLPSAKLLLSLNYQLNLTRDNAEVFNCRQLFQVDQEIFAFVEYGYERPYAMQSDSQLEIIDNVEGLILSGPLDLILGELMVWLVEVDPIGFEILRRMNRDGFVEELAVTEELWERHDSDNLLDKWFNEITNYADSIELSSFMSGVTDKESLLFDVALKSAVYEADSHSKSDFYRHSDRWNWTSPTLRENHDD
jgi:hypothetical protein